MEISSQQVVATTRGVETTRPSSVNVNSTPPPNSSDRIDTSNEEQTAAQKREQQNYEQNVARQLQQLQSRDREVRAHEAAHIAAGGQYVSSGPQYTYQRGPNGRFYAIGGEVQLDVSAIPSNPEATLDKAEVIRRAALAPAQPSPQDLRVASNATRLASRARVEIAIQQREQQQAQVEAGKDKKAEENVAESSVITGTTFGASTYGNASLAEPARDVFDIVA